jgi:hypothetical protein
MAHVLLENTFKTHAGLRSQIGPYSGLSYRKKKRVTFFKGRKKTFTFPEKDFQTLMEGWNNTNSTSGRQDYSGQKKRLL